METFKRLILMARMAAIKWLAGTDIVVAINGKSTPKQAIIIGRDQEEFVRNWTFEGFHIGAQVDGNEVKFGVEL